MKLTGSAITLQSGLGTYELQFRIRLIRANSPAGQFYANTGMGKTSRNQLAIRNIHPLPFLLLYPRGGDFEPNRYLAGPLCMLAGRIS